jgi:hypothetical protein
LLAVFTADRSRDPGVVVVAVATVASPPRVRLLRDSLRDPALSSSVLRAKRADARRLVVFATHPSRVARTPSTNDEDAADGEVEITRAR